MRVRANSGAGDGWLGMLLRVWLLSGQCVRECAGAGWTDKGLLAIENCTRGEYQPGALSYASSRNRSAQHRAGTLFGLQSKVEMAEVLADSMARAERSASGETKREGGRPTLRDSPVLAPRCRHAAASILANLQG